MAGTWCPDCRAFMADGTTCPECRRRRAWGTINAAISELLDLRRSAYGPVGQVLSELEAVALLMQERQALIHRHHREIRDELWVNLEPGHD